MDKVVFGQYVPGNSYIYRIDPRIKLISLVIFIVTIFILPSIYGILVMLAITILLCLSSRISVLRIIRGIKPMLFLLLFTFFIQTMYVRTGDIAEVFGTKLYFTMNLGLWNLLIIVFLIIVFSLLSKVIKFKFLLFLVLLVGSFICQNSIYENINFLSYDLAFYYSGLERASFVLIRMVVLIMMSSLLTFTTSPNELNNAVESLLAPLKIVKINPGLIGMMISITLRFVPTLLMETEKIMRAQTSRGVDFKDSKFSKKITQIIALLVPMFVISFKRADDLANAMESRGYVIGEPRTKYDKMTIKLIDIVTLFLVCMLMAAGIWSNFL